MTLAFSVAAWSVVLTLIAVWFWDKRTRRLALLPPDIGHVMVDLETLGTSPGCKILSVGAVLFDQRGALKAFYAEIKRHEGQDMLAEDPDTVAWWAKQSPEARTLLSNPEEEKHTLTAGLILFNQWLRDNVAADDRGNLKMWLWGNGADFDNAVLAHAYRAVNVKQGWPYWSNRCYRTLKNLRPDIALERTGTHHNALDDAVTQADHAAAILVELRLWQ